MKYIALFLILFLTLNDVAEARSRFRKSFGRRSSRSLFSNKNRMNHFKKRPSQAQRNQRSNAFNRNTQRPRSGGFLRTMAGAMAGTMIGSMLFRALGLGNGTGPGGSFFMIILLAGVAFVAYRLFKSRYAVAAPGHTGYTHIPTQEESTDFTQESSEETDELRLGDDTDFKTDRSRDFFSIQHAWSKKDLTPVRHLLTTVVEDEFNKEIQEMNDSGITSTLENLMIENTEVVSSWSESEESLVTIKFDVSLIEYEMDNAGNIIRGRKDSYTKMTEFWTFSKNSNEELWKVCAIENP